MSGVLKINETMQQEYDRLLTYLIGDGESLILEKPICFRKTPHSNSSYVYSIEAGIAVECYGLAKFTVMQVLRRLSYKKQEIEKLPQHKLKPIEVEVIEVSKNLFPADGAVIIRMKIEKSW